MTETRLTNNIFQFIKLQYGESMLADVRLLERTKLKYGNYTNHLRFSLRCLHANLLPNDLQLKCKVNTSRSREILHKAGKFLLQERIHLNHVTRDGLKQKVEELSSKLTQKLSTEEYDKISSIHAQNYEKVMTSVKERHVRKFNCLVAKTARIDQANKTIVDKERWIMNLSDKVLSETEISLLSKGMNFSITPKEVPVKEIISAVENSVKNLLS